MSPLGGTGTSVGNSKSVIDNFEIYIKARTPTAQQKRIHIDCGRLEGVLLRRRRHKGREGRGVSPLARQLGVRRRRCYCQQVGKLFDPIVARRRLNVAAKIKVNLKAILRHLAQRDRLRRRIDLYLVKVTSPSKPVVLARFR